MQGSALRASDGRHAAVELVGPRRHDLEQPPARADNVPVPLVDDLAQLGEPEVEVHVALAPCHTHRLTRRRVERVSNCADLVHVAECHTETLGAGFVSRHR
jgi:hypothetical protein